jgi:hypothetical protein
MSGIFCSLALELASCYRVVNSPFPYTFLEIPQSTVTFTYNQTNGVFFWRLDYSKISSSVHALSRNKQYSSLKHRHSTVRLHTILPPTTPPDHASIQSHPTHSKHHPHQPKINRLPIVPTGTCPDSQREKPCIPEIHRSASHAGDTGWVASARYCACSEAHMQVHVRSHVAFLRREGTFCLCVPCLCYVG